MKEIPIPENYVETVKQKYIELIETLAEIDPEIEELYLAEEEISLETLKKSIRK